VWSRREIVNTDDAVSHLIAEAMWTCWSPSACVRDLRTSSLYGRALPLNVVATTRWPANTP
jgi:hypothetical protein